MSKPDEARRAFLVSVAAGAVAGAGLGRAALAQTEQHSATTSPAAAAPPAVASPPAHARGDVVGHGAFLNDNDAMTVAALTERLMPGAPGKPGARDAGVLNYIDLALAGAYADLQDFYRRGLAQLDAHCRTTYGAPFVALDAGRQDQVIVALEDGRAAGFSWPSAPALFNTIRTHTMEGMFADPIYGGNKDFAGWRLVGFPGAQPLFTPEDMQSGQAYTGAPTIGLQAQAKG